MNEDPIIGWRCWRYNPDTKRLYSTIYGTRWLPCERLDAKCTAAGNVTCLSPSQVECTCGIHAWRDKSCLSRIVQVESTGIPVFGQVSLWGRVVQCEFGFRAQYAYPYSLLVLPQHADFAKDIRNEYLVDVAVMGD